MSDLDLTYFKVPIDADHHMPRDPLDKLITTRVNRFNILLNRSMEEYIAYKYNASREYVERVAPNVNNFQLKGSNFVRTYEKGVECYYDNGKLILTGDIFNSIITEHWKHEGEINNGKL